MVFDHTYGAFLCPVWRVPPNPYEQSPVPAGTYDDALHVDHLDAPSLLEQYLDKPEPKVGGAPKETDAP